MSKYSIGNITGQLYDSLLQRRRAVEFEKSLLFKMQEHADNLRLRYAELARRGSSGGGGSRGVSRSGPPHPASAEGRALGEEFRAREEYARQSRKHMTRSKNEN